MTLVIPTGWRRAAAAGDPTVSQSQSAPQQQQQPPPRRPEAARRPRRHPTSPSQSRSISTSRRPRRRWSSAASPSGSSRPSLAAASAGRQGWLRRAGRAPIPRGGGCTGDARAAARDARLQRPPRDIPCRPGRTSSRWPRRARRRTPHQGQRPEHGHPDQALVPRRPQLHSATVAAGRRQATARRRGLRASGRHEQEPHRAAVRWLASLFMEVAKHEAPTARRSRASPSSSRPTSSTRPPTCTRCRRSS